MALFTEDVAAVVPFYRKLLGAAPKSEWPGGPVFAVAGVELLVHARGPAVPGGPPNEDHVALEVADLEAACDALRAHGVAFLAEPREYPWGRSSYLRDPDGRLVELLQL